MVTVAIRADSSSTIGGGHVMRSLALAQELRALEADVRFVSRRLPGNLSGLVAERGYAVTELPPGVGDAIDPATDASMTSRVLERPVDWLVVDHYELDAAWERAAGSGARRILAIDDLATRSHECDMLLDQNRVDGEAAYDGLVPPRTRRLVGPRYALLRREFSHARRALRPRSGELRRVLVCFGSADATRQTAKVVGALAQFRGLAVDVVAGGSNRDAERIRALCDQFAHMCFHHGAGDMARLMANADLAIGAAGSMTWERCCLGLPTLMLVCAPNQRAPAETALRCGVALGLGDAREVDEGSIARAISRLQSQPRVRQNMSDAGMRLVDGRGARRVAETMLDFRLDAATAGDAQLVWRWANDPAVRANAFNSECIAMDAHLRWYGRRLEDPLTRIYIVRVGEAAVGQVRFELDSNVARIDISVDPAWRAKGIGERALEIGLDKLAAQHPGVSALAEVKAANTSSRNLFARAGFSCRPSPRVDAVEFRRATQPADSP